MFVVLIRFILSMPWWYPRLIKDKALERKDGTVRLYGVEGYVGLAGSGKTMAVCKRLRDLRREYGDKIYIATNFYYDDEDFRLCDWRDLLKTYDRTLVVVWDELPTLFNSRAFKSMPIDLIQQLTQMRKGNGVLLLYTSQRIFMCDKYFREISNWIWDCKCWFGVFNVLSRYHPAEFAEMESAKQIDRKMRIKPLRTTFVQTEELRNCYDSFQFLDSVKQTEYMGRDEIAALNANR